MFRNSKKSPFGNGDIPWSYPQRGSMFRNFTKLRGEDIKMSKEENFSLPLCFNTGKKMPKAKSKTQILNRRASFDYEFLETYTAGIVLAGTEIKSIRAGKASLVDAFCYFDARGQLYVKGMNVATYFWGSWGQHEPTRDRKLLLNKRELRSLRQSVKLKGLTIVATKLFISDNGYAKLNIALAKGKKEYDKRNSIKEKDIRREMDRSGY